MSAPLDPTALARPPAAAPGELPSGEAFHALLQRSVAEHRLSRLVLGKSSGSEPGLLRVLVRPLTLKDQPCLSFVYRYATRDVTRNLPVPDGLQAVRDLLAGSFSHAHLLTSTEDIQLLVSKKGRHTLRRTPMALAAPTASVPPATSASGHDREKQRHLSLAQPYLMDLGVTDAQQRLIPSMSRKWKQINKFIEVMAHALESTPLRDADKVRVVDFGSGKGYLTFAMHDYLHGTLGKAAQVTGVELRGDLVDLCNQAAQRRAMLGLAFDKGDVSNYPLPAVDIMIALHACDTATDHAIHMGLRAGASIIMCSPCCHKQIRPQLLSPHPLRPVLQHGIHLGQEAEMVTDSLRALLLESQGYDTRVFEFIALEHTSKNKMILAVKRDQPRSPEPWLAQVQQVKAFYGIREQCLESLLNADGLAVTPAAAPAATPVDEPVASPVETPTGTPSV